MLQFKGLQFAANFNNISNKKFKEAQECIDNETINKLEYYTPVSMDKGYNKRLKRVIPFVNKGKMSRSHKAETPGTIINTEPKARREYYTNKGFSGQGKFWLERMKADHKNDILKKAKEKFT